MKNYFNLFLFSALLLVSFLSEAQRAQFDYVENAGRSQKVNIPAVAVSDYFLTASSTQTVTNKTILGGTVSGSTIVGANITSLSLEDDDFELKDNLDNTKKAVFQLSGISSGTTRTYSLPNESATLAVEERGSFTPAITGTSSAGVGTYSTRWGYYTRIANRVLFTVYFVWTAHTGTGNISITGLPFATNSSNGIAAFSGYSDGLALSSASIFMWNIGNNSTTIGITQYSPTAGNAAAVPMDSSVAGGLMVTGQYFTN